MKFGFDFLLFAHQATGVLFIVCGFLVFMTGVGMLTGTVNWIGR